MTDPGFEGNRSAGDAPDKSAAVDSAGAVTRLVEAVRALLADALPRDALKVEGFPDKPGDYDLGTYDSAVLVHYRGSKYGPSTNGGASQPRTPALDVHLFTRGLAGRSGAYDLLEEIRLALQGRSIEGATGFQAVSDGLLGETGGVWQYVITFQASVPAVARRPAQFSPLRANFSGGQP